jgi:hypothetical protein
MKFWHALVAGYCVLFAFDRSCDEFLIISALANGSSATSVPLSSGSGECSPWVHWHETLRKSEDLLEFLPGKNLRIHRSPASAQCHLALPTCSAAGSRSLVANSRDCYGRQLPWGYTLPVHEPRPLYLHAQAWDVPILVLPY